MASLKGSKKDAILDKFEIYDEFVVCLVCNIQISKTQDQACIIKNHLREYSHQNKLHGNYVKKRESQIQYPIFNLKEAKKLYKSNKKDLFTYFDDQLQKVFQSKALKSHSQKTYHSVLKKLYFPLFLQGKNTITATQIKQEMLNQKAKQNKSILRQFMSLIEFNASSNEQLKPSHQFNNEFQTEVVNDYQFIHQNLDKFVNMISDLGYNKLSIIIILLSETNLQLDDLQDIQYNQLLEGTHIIPENPKAKNNLTKFVVSKKLSQKYNWN